MKNNILIKIAIFALFVNTSNINAQKTNTFKDKRDGKIYKTVKIDNQIWMAENLSYKANSGCWAYKDESKLAKYGSLYNWEMAKTVCPSGWHLPSDAEWKTLEQSLGMPVAEVNEVGWRGKGVGAKMKSSSDWKLYAGKNYGNNKSRFNALPSGYYDSNNRVPFVDVGTDSYFWSSTSNGKSAWVRNFYGPDDKVNRFDYYKIYGFSVRCIKN